nr:MAG TPA: hypothetical protein [Bacteriophage sp.]
MKSSSLIGWGRLPGVWCVTWCQPPSSLAAMLVPGRFRQRRGQWLILLRTLMCHLCHLRVLSCWTRTVKRLVCQLMQRRVAGFPAPLVGLSGGGEAWSQSLSLNSKMLMRTAMFLELKTLLALPGLCTRPASRKP